MAIGRTWQESVQKALRGMETGLDGWSLPKKWKRLPNDQLLYNLRVPNPDRIMHMHQAMDDGMSIEQIRELTNFDPWWLAQLAELHQVEAWISSKKLADLTVTDWREIKQRGYSDAQVAQFTGARPPPQRWPRPPLLSAAGLAACSSPAPAHLRRSPTPRPAHPPDPPPLPPRRARATQASP
jgi:carbamoyl-phosphate synthase large subunit